MSFLAALVSAWTGAALPAAAEPRCAVPAADPAAAEVREAMRIAGLSVDVAMPTAKAIDEDCFPGTQLALYDHIVRVILVGDRWREVGGLTRLIHEMKHYADDLAGRAYDDECGATHLAADWADAHGFINEARRERRYGALFCEADTVIAPVAPVERADASGNDGVLRAASMLLPPPDH